MNKLILPTLIISLVATSTSWAKGGHHDKSQWAKVTRVEPVIQSVKHHIPQETCWNEPVRQTTQRHTSHRNSTHSNNDAFAGTIVGGIIGGVIGHKIGHNKGNKNFGTVLGAVVGASVGNGLSNQHRSVSRSHSEPRHQPSHRTERYCDVVTTVRYREKVVGYDVWYRYHGEQYHTRMDNHPGERIRVRVNVRPH
tara:strand:+ start:32274 stop:32858 length:585 start_codon:yes stop_codon:yes gene_type:complete